MPINHFTSDLPERFWCTKQHHLTVPSNDTPSAATNSQFYHHHAAAAAAAAMFSAQNAGYSFNLNDKNEEEEESEEQQNHATKEEQEELMEIPKEPLFEKPLTPSDVGKLNRLVIPKQHAEKYFPLSGAAAAEKGLLLSFDDECGKTWRFRYSYWNSSQSYVLTKGWSRFVKEKRLDAGDVVLFERHRVDGDRLFIGWRRRSSSTAAVQDGNSGAAPPSTVGGGGGWAQVWHPYPPPATTPAIPYQPNCLHAGSSSGVGQSQTGTSGNSKRLVRLFGVNLECEPDESEPTTPDRSTTSSHTQPGQHHPFQYYANPHASYTTHYNHVDVKFSRDVNQMRYQQG